MEKRLVHHQIPLISHDQPAEIRQSGNRPFDDPAMPVSPQRSAILRGWPLLAPAMRTDQFDSAFRQPTPQTVAVVALVGDDPIRFESRSAAADARHAP